MTSATEILPPLRALAQTHGMTKLAATTGIPRPSLYRMLEDDGNPTLANLLLILAALGLRIKVQPEPVNVLELPDCPHCKKTREAFAARSTCAFGGCPWGGDF